LNQLFDYTYQSLTYLSEVTGFTYREINIIIWFYLIPFVWLMLIDKIKHTNRYKIIGGDIMFLSLILIPNFKSFSHNLFDHSANFLKSFDLMGLNYTYSSVVFCLFIPFLFSLYLIKKAYFNKK
jgi:hypothetical protein